MTDDYIEKFYEQSLNQPIPYRKGKHWGYSNIWGDILIEPQYEKVDLFYQTELSDVDSYRALVQKNGRFYVIDKYNTRLSNNYEKAEAVDPYDVEYVYFEVYSNAGKVGVFLKNKLIAEPIYDEVEADNQYIKVRTKDKYGLMDYNGSLVIPVEYDAIEAISSENESRILTNWETTLNGNVSSISIVNNAEMGITDEDIFDDDFFNTMVISMRKEDDIIKRIDNNGKQGVVVLKSNKNIKPEYDAIEVADGLRYENPVQVKDYNAMHQKVLFIVEKEGLFGIIDEDSKLVLPIEMTSIKNNGYDIFEIKRNDLIGRYNYPNKTIFFTDYNEISYPESIDLNDSESYKIYKIISKDRRIDYIGENGIKYYED